ncbi:MAG TPA: TlpA disulfide reductase family protein [Puia sp.]|nr:TlpA disulfide reductase family protein [Puia sp.]
MNRMSKSCPRGQLFSWMIAPAILVLLVGCHGKREHRVVFHLTGGFNRHFVIERVGLNADSSSVLDSGAGRNGRDSFIYTLPVSEPSIYRIRLQERSFEIPFIYDSSDIGVFCNYTTGEYHYANSPASDEWKRFQQGQVAIARRERALVAARLNDSSRQAIDSLLGEIYRRNFNFADTTRNPALFLLAYNLVDFGRDYAGLEQFIQRAAKRFPSHSGVQTLVRNTLDFVRTFRTPLQPGDTMPRLRLPDTAGREVTIGPEPGKYMLVDFWSTWCDQCRPFAIAKKKVRSLSDTGRLAMISIAVDAEKDNWLNIVRSLRDPWLQLIDEKMWSGPAARTFRFDSLPFNYLVGPDGRILARSIPADSLIPVFSAAKIINSK